MSSNQNNSSSKRIKSIRRRLASGLVGRKISVCLGHDFLLIVLVIFTWFAAAEYLATGVVDLFSQERTRTIVYENHYESDVLKNDKKAIKEFRKSLFKDKDKSYNEIISIYDDSFRYIVIEKSSGKVLVSASFLDIFIRTVILVSILFIMQVIVHWMSYPSESERVKRILKPLNELAQKADEIAKYDFSEDKYHLIEEKITSLEPDDERISSLGDEDLLGIENAMNNLIARIHEKNRQQARFVNDASHELRTPIAVIQGYANMLSRWGREDEKVLDESITAIKNESDNMKYLVEQLLFLARGDAGRTVINKERVSLNEIMREVYEESLMIDENHIYKYSCPEDEIFVMADENLLKQSVRILVDNAAKYTEEKWEIRLSVHRKDGYGVLQVQDSGIGMQQSDVEHMFERFYRADEARSYNGTGLGLSIAKWIVDKHEGHFEIVSREELGTRIGIYISMVD